MITSRRTQPNIVLLIIGLFFLVRGFYGMMYPEDITIRLNGRIVETDFSNTLPQILLGAVLLFAFCWMLLKFFKVQVDETGMIVFMILKRAIIPWDEIEKMSPCSIPRSYWKIKTKKGKTFFICGFSRLSIQELIDSFVQFKFFKTDKLWAFLLAKKNEYDL